MDEEVAWLAPLLLVRRVAMLQALLWHVEVVKIGHNSKKRMGKLKTRCCCYDVHIGPSFSFPKSIK